MFTIIFILANDKLGRRRHVRYSTSINKYTNTLLTSLIELNNYQAALMSSLSLSLVEK